MSDGREIDEFALSMRCRVCARAAAGLHGPRYKPRRWFRRKPFWRCSWCRHIGAPVDFDATEASRG